MSGPFVFFASSDAACVETGDLFRSGAGDTGEGEVVGVVEGDGDGDWDMST